MKVRSPLALAVVLLALTACGGGGGGSLAPPVTVAEITSANAPLIAGAVMKSSLEGRDLGAFANPGDTLSAPAAAPAIEPTMSPATAAAQASARKASLVHSKVAELAEAHADSTANRLEPNVLQAEIGPETAPCTDGGSVTISGDIANTSTLTAGDTLVFVFDECVETDGTVDGRFQMTVTSFSGDLVSDVFSFGVTVELTAFAVTVDGETATAAGDVSMTIAATATPALTTTITSTSLSLAENGASYTLNGYSLSQTIDGATGQYSLMASGTLSSSVFAGTVSFETIATLVGTGTAFAFAGEMRITGAGGAAITVIVLDETFVRLEVDVDGDGTVDETIDSSWADLT
jgi:hypothetical protein